MKVFLLTFFLVFVSALTSYGRDFFLTDGYYRISISGQASPVFANVFVKGDKVRMIPETQSDIIKGEINATIKDKRFNGVLSQESSPTIDGMLIDNNLIDAIISSPISNGKVCSISREGHFKDDLRKELSRKNIQLLYKALVRYSITSNGSFFPLQKGADGFEALRKNNCLRSTEDLLCPGTDTEIANEEERIVEINTDYVYSPMPSGKIPADGVPLLWDKSANFKNGGHVLFSTGEIVWIDGENWQEQIPKTSAPSLAKQPKIEKPDSR